MSGRPTFDPAPYWTRSLALTTWSPASGWQLPEHLGRPAGEEFKDYCFFCASPTRVPRNALTGILPETVARTYSGFELAEAGHGRYYAALNSSTYSPSQYLESRW